MRIVDGIAQPTDEAPALGATGPDATRDGASQRSAPNAQRPTPALDVRGLTVCYPTGEGTVVALQDVSFTLRAGEALAVMGESGCGKSTLGRALLGLLPPPGRMAAGSVRLHGRRVEGLSPTAWQPLRGREIAMLLQDPAQTLNPVLPIGLQLAETVRDEHGHAPGRREVEARGMQLLRSVGFEDPERIWRSYPFQLSGGMVQRAALAIALVNRPRVLVADEPTTALDVRVQAQVLEVLRRLQAEMELAIVIITHDVGVAAAVADWVAVLYAGRLVEIGPAAQVLREPAHPYTAALLACLPSPSGGLPRPLGGQPPSLIEPPDRCPLAPRCSRASGQCVSAPHPAPAEVRPRQLVACYHPVGPADFQGSGDTATRGHGDAATRGHGEGATPSPNGRGSLRPRPPPTARGSPRPRHLMAHVLMATCMLEKLETAFCWRRTGSLGATASVGWDGGLRSTRYVGPA